MAWPVTVTLVLLGVVFVALTAPLWRDPSRPIARRGFVYSGPYLLLVVAAIIANFWILGWGVPTGF